MLPGIEILAPALDPVAVSVCGCPSLTKARFSVEIASQAGATAAITSVRVSTAALRAAVALILPTHADDRVFTFRQTLGAMRAKSRGTD